MTSATHIRAVIFDMDGLMLNTEVVARITWKQAFQEFGYEMDEKKYPQIIGRKYTDIGEILRHQYGADFPYEAISVRRDQLGEQYFTDHGIDRKPGLLELLDFLDVRNIPKAVASSTIRKRVMRRLTITGVVDRFPVIVCGDEVQNGKPAPDIFLKAAKKLDVPPEHCLVLEDSNPGIEDRESLELMRKQENSLNCHESADFIIAMNGERPHSK